MRLAMIIGAWCAVFCFCAPDCAFAACQSGSLDAFCDHARPDPFDADRPGSFGGESARPGAARPAIRRKVRRVSPTPQAQVDVAGAKGLSREAMYAHCRNAVIRAYGRQYLLYGRHTTGVPMDWSTGQIDSCVANGGKPM